MLELLDYLWEVGPVEATPMGLAPVSWQSIAAYQEATGVELDPWECKQIRVLSLAYLDQYNRAQEANCPAPWVEPEYINRSALSDRIKEQFRAFQQRRSRNGNRKHQSDHRR